MNPAAYRSSRCVSAGRLRHTSSGRVSFRLLRWTGSRKVKFTGAAILRVADACLKDLKDTCRNIGIGTFVRFEPGGSPIESLALTEFGYPSAGRFTIKVDV